MSLLDSNSKQYVFSEHAQKRLEELSKKFPKKSSLVMWALHIIQEEEGYIPEEAIPAVAIVAEVSPAWVKGVVSFYAGFHEHKQGTYNIQVCYNASCWLMGSDKIETCLEKKLNLKMGETDPKGHFTITRTQECLAGCDKAPVMMVNHDYYENLTTDVVEQLIDDLQKLLK